MDQHQNYLYASPSSKEILSVDYTHNDDGPFFTVHADEALYKGKNLGKNTFTIYRTEG